MEHDARREATFELLQHRILTHYEAARGILKGEMPAPRTAIVYPTYVCNQNCVWCEYAEDNDALRTVMTDERLRGLLRELRALGVTGVEFCGGGEPTLHPTLAAVIRDMRADGMRIGLLTNGTKLEGALAEAVVDCASYARIGFDGATAEMMERVKRPKSPEARFDALCAKVRGLVALRNARGTGLRISIKVVLDTQNCGQVEDCVRLAADLGVDSIQFKAARLCDTELSAEQARETGEAIARARANHPEVPVVGDVGKLNMTEQCWLTPLQVMVDALGDVFLCCYYRHRRERHRFGNVFEQPLREIWYGERHWEAIRGIRPHECNVLDCRFVHYNRIMSELLLEDHGQFEFI